jgi:glutathione S-transferase
VIYFIAGRRDDGGLQREPPTMTHPLRLHGFALSGHSHRVELMLSLLALPHTVVPVDLAAGAHKQPDFLALNPFGQVPVLEDGDLVLADSNAILVYLASRYDPDRRWLPLDPVEAAQVQRWLSVAAGEVFSGSAAARRAAIFKAPVDVAAAQALAERLHRILDAELATKPYLVGDRPTIADVALYSYTAKCHEGGVDLSGHPNVVAWLGRIEALPGFKPMPDAPARAA